MSPLQKIWADIHDRDRWPPELVPVDVAEFALRAVTAEELSALASRPDQPPVAADPKAVERGREPVERG